MTRRNRVKQRKPLNYRKYGKKRNNPGRRKSSRKKKKTRQVKQNRWKRRLSWKMYCRKTERPVIKKILSAKKFYKKKPVVVQVMPGIVLTVGMALPRGEPFISPYKEAALCRRREIFKESRNL